MTTMARGIGPSRILLLLLTTVAASCGDSPTASQRQLLPTPLAQMVVVSGDGQSAPAGTELPSPVVVRLVDEDSRPVANQVVNFRVTAGGGSVAAGTVVTNADGVAQDRWTLGSAGTPQALEARAVDAATGGKVVFALFTATAIDPTTIVASVAVSPSTAELEVGDTRQLNAVAHNSAGGPVPGKTFEWSSSNTAVATVSANGLVTAVAPGTVTISAATEGHTGTATAEVAEPPVVDTDPPGTPGTPAFALSAQTADSVTVTASWSAAADAAVYEWRTGSNGGGFEREGEATGTSAAFRAPLSTDTSGFWFCVKARDEAGNVGDESACSNYDTPAQAEPDPVVATVAVSPASSSLEVGATVQLAATAREADGSAIAGKSFTWTSSNTSVATVSAGGLVTARAAGSATITARTDGVSGTATITVTSAPPTVATVAVTPSSATLETGDTRQLSAAARDASGNTIAGKTFSWSSSNTTVATVSSSGLVTARAAGSATITASVDGKSGTATVTVQAPPPPPEVETVAVSPASATVAIGATRQLSATARDSDGTAIAGKTFSWSSNDTGVATVSASGLVTARAAGSATITATVDGKSGTATITVPAPGVASVAVSPTSATVAIGATRQLSATARDGDGNTVSGKTFSWTSSNTTVATVSASGLVTARAAGSATITASVDGRSGTATITVPAPTAATVAVSPTSATVAIGATRQLSATARDADGNTISGKTFSWTSSNTSVATVSSNGLVTARAAGSATITASVDGKSATATITVPEPTVATVAVSPTSASISVGATRQLSATARDADGNTIAGKTFSWTSSNTGVATVSSSGLVTARAAGSATITASVDGESGSAAITVTAGGGGGTTARLFEDFSTYTSTSQMLSDPRGIYVPSENVGTGQMLLDTSVGYGSSSQSLRYTHTNGQTISRSLNLMTIGAGTDLWTEIVVRFSPGWTVGAAYKLLHINTNMNNGSRFGLNFENGTGGSLNAEAPAANYDSGHLPTIESSAILDGDWHTIRYHTRIDGSQVFHEVWIDGQYRGSRGPLSARSGGHEYNLMSLGANMNESNGHTQHLWWGKVSVWTSDPGW